MGSSLYGRAENNPPKSEEKFPFWVYTLGKPEVDRSYLLRSPDNTFGVKEN
jgi:hypothetical protein